MTNLNIIANTSWRDISTAPKDGTVFLAWGTLHERGESMCERPYWEVVFWLGGDAGCWFSPASGRIDGLTHWQPLPPPPGEDDVGNTDAIQARCDELEADRNQVIQELIEKVGPKASVYSYNRYGGGELEWDYNVADWLKSQMEGE